MTISRTDDLLHIETELGIINIREGLRDMHGRKVVSIAVTPDAYAGEPKVVLRGLHNTRLVQLKGRKKGS